MPNETNPETFGVMKSTMVFSQSVTQGYSAEKFIVLRFDFQAQSNIIEQSVIKSIMAIFSVSDTSIL